MSLAEVPEIMDRISAATKDSRIAVFMCSDKGFVTKGKLDAIFADTTMGKKRMEIEKYYLVGVYHAERDEDYKLVDRWCSANRSKIENELRQAIKW